MQNGSTRWDLQQTFRINDQSNSGACPRDDFVNACFDTIRGLKPSDLMKLVTTFADEYENLVNYADFLRLIDRQG